MSWLLPSHSAKTIGGRVFLLRYLWLFWDAIISFSNAWFDVIIIDGWNKNRWLMQIWWSMGRHSMVNVLELPAGSNTDWFAYLPIVHSQMCFWHMFLCGNKNRRDTIPLSVNIHNYSYNACMSQCTHLPKIGDLKHCSTSQFQTVQWPAPYSWVSGPVSFF